MDNVTLRGLILGALLQWDGRPGRDYLASIDDFLLVRADILRTLPADFPTDPSTYTIAREIQRYAARVISDPDAVSARDAWGRHLAALRNG
jgi:hypothetical protein